MKRVDFPDGSSIDFPDDTPPEEMQRVSQQHHDSISSPKAPAKTGLGWAAERVGDAALNAGASVNQALKGFSDLAGADNAASRFFADNASTLESQLSDETKAQSQADAEAMAATEGFGNKFALGAKQAAASPLQTFGKAIGFVAPTLVTGGAGTAAGMGVRGLTALNAITGAAQGAGAIKGGIYDTVMQAQDADLMADPNYAALRATMPEAQAKETFAAQQQSYSENPGKIALGAGVGAATGVVGAEAAIANSMAKGQARAALAKEAALSTIPKVMAKEGATEVPQEMMESYLGNTGAASGGANIDPMQGVAEAGGQSLVMAPMSGGVGAGMQVSSARRQLKGMPESAATDAIDANTVLDAEAPTQAPLALPAPVVRVDAQGNARMDGVAPPVQDERQAGVVGRNDEVRSAVREELAALGYDPTPRATPTPIAVGPDGTAVADSQVKPNDVTVEPPARAVGRAPVDVQERVQQEIAALGLDPTKRATPTPISVDSQGAAALQGDARSQFTAEEQALDERAKKMFPKDEAAREDWKVAERSRSMGYEAMLRERATASNARKKGRGVKVNVERSKPLQNVEPTSELGVVRQQNDDGSTSYFFSHQPDVAMVVRPSQKTSARAIVSIANDAQPALLRAALADGPVEAGRNTVARGAVSHVGDTSTDHFGVVRLIGRGADKAKLHAEANRLAAKSANIQASRLFAGTPEMDLATRAIAADPQRAVTALRKKDPAIVVPALREITGEQDGGAAIPERVSSGGGEVGDAGRGPGMAGRGQPDFPDGGDDGDVAQPWNTGPDGAKVSAGITDGERDAALNDQKVATSEMAEIEKDPHAVAKEYGAQDDPEFATYVADAARDAVNAGHLTPEEFFAATRAARENDHEKAISILKQADERRGQAANNLGESTNANAQQDPATRRSSGAPRSGDGPDAAVARPGDGGEAWVGAAVRKADAVIETGIHYGRQALSYLSGGRFGTGLKGAERKRLQGADPRLSKRIYFYVPKSDGSMPSRESGLGGEVHRLKMGNLFDGKSSENLSYDGTDNGFELAVIEAGYDGYLARDMGVAVLLNQDSVPVSHLGNVSEVQDPMVTEAGKLPPKPAQPVKMALMSREAAALEPRMAELQKVAPGATLRMGMLTVDAQYEDAARQFLKGSPRSKARVNLSASTGSIPGLSKLYGEANAGDKSASSALNGVAEDALRRLTEKIPSARVEYEDNQGLYYGDLEPSLGMSVTFEEQDRQSVLAALAKFADNFNQQQIHVRQETDMPIGHDFGDGSFSVPVRRFELTRPLTRQEVEDVVKKSGLVGLTSSETYLETYYVGDVNDQAAIANFTAALDRAGAALGQSNAGVGRATNRLWRYGQGFDANDRPIPYSAIAGDVRTGEAGASPTAKRLAERRTGAEVKPAQQAAEITAEQRALQTGIKDAYEAMPMNDLANPDVRKAYEELAKEVKEQFESIPVKVEVLSGQGEPYDGSADMRRDVLDNNHLYIYGTDAASFGPKGVTYDNHPLLEDSGLVDINKRPLLMNDLLRAVHDYYAHTMSPVEFGPKGEEAAWKNHMAMTASPWARWALTSETRGQNSWVNFREGIDKLPLKERGFAEQKVGLLPIEFAMTGDPTVDGPMEVLRERIGEDRAKGSQEADPDVRRARKATHRMGEAEDMFGQEVGDRRDMVMNWVIQNPTDARKALKLPSFKAAKEITKRAFAEAVDRYRKNKVRLDDGSKRAIAKLGTALADEVEWYSRYAKDAGLDWYGKKFQNAIDELSQKVPSLKSKEDRGLFTALLAITSDGTEVQDNMNNAMGMYLAFKDGKKLADSTPGKGKYESSYQKNAEFLDDLIGKHGVQKTLDRLLEPMKVSDVKAELRAMGETSPASDYPDDAVMPRAAVYLGPKLGAFYANLMGETGYLTMDRWWNRTINRYRGHMAASATDSSLETFAELTGRSDLSEEKLFELAQNVAAQRQAKYEAAKKAGEFYTATKVETLATTIDKNARTELNDSPLGKADRAFQIAVVKHAKQALAERGIDADIAAIQAAIWYYEKELFASIGVRGRGRISYEEAARNWVDKRGRSAASGNGQADRKAKGADVRGEPGQGETGDLFADDGFLRRKGGGQGRLGNELDSLIAKDASPRQKQLISDFTRALTRDAGRPVQVSLLAVEPGSQGAALAADVKKRLGVDVVFFHSTDKAAPAGASVSSIPNAVFVGTKTRRPEFVLGHELLHDLRTAHPDLYQALVTKLREHAQDTLANAEEIRADYQDGSDKPVKVSDSLIEEENMADVSGVAFADPGFWTDFEQALNPSQIKTFFRWVSRWFGRHFGDVKSKSNLADPSGLAAAAADMRSDIAAAYAEAAKRNAGARSLAADLDLAIYARRSRPTKAGTLQPAGQNESTAPSVPTTVSATSLEEIGSGRPAPITNTPAFKRWFGNSLVVDEGGDPLVVYRGEHGKTEDGDVQTLIGSYTFIAERDIANTYAESPNDYRVQPEASRVVPAYLRIENPVINNRDDPFWEFSDIIEKFGLEEAKRLAIKHADSIENTGNWMDDEDGQYAGLDSVKQLVKEKPELISTLYMDAYPLLDDKEFVELATSKGYDGGIHVGNGESAMETEYRVFSKNQIKSAVGNNGDFDLQSPNILRSRGERPVAGWDQPERSAAQRVVDTTIMAASKSSSPVTASAQVVNKAVDRIGQELARLTGAKKIGEKVASGVQKAIDSPSRWEWVERVKHGLISDYGIPEEYLSRKVDKQARENRQLRDAKHLLDHMSGMSPDQLAIAYQWLQEKPDTARERELLSKLSPEQRDTMNLVKDSVDRLSKEAVSQGLISQETYDRNAMAYVHRSYKKYEAELTGSQIMANQRAQRIKGDQFKGRGMEFEASLDRVHGELPEDLKGLKLEMLEKRGADGRLTRRDYIVAGSQRPAAFKDYESKGTWEVRDATRTGKLKVWRDFTLAERQRMGEIEDARYGFARTMLQGVRDVETARFLSWVGDNYAKDSDEGLEVAEINPIKQAMGSQTYTRDEWVKVPETKIRGTQVNRYGSLAGKYVPGVMWNDLIAMGDFQNTSWDKLLRMWKISKTALSPAVHVNNVMANFIMADLADVGVNDLRKSLEVIVKSKRGDAEAKALIERYQDSGAEGGSFAANEMKTEVIEPLLKQIVDSEPEAVQKASLAQVVSLAAHGRIGEAAGALPKTLPGRATGATVNAMISAYQSEDSVFRLAKFINEVNAGKSDVEAGKAARDSFLDYNINAPWIRTAKRTALPFISFTYRAAPLLAKAALTKPWKFGKYLALGYGMGVLAYGMLGASGDEEREKRLLPKDRQGLSPIGIPKLVRMPWNDKDGDPVWLDVRRWIPGGDIFDLNDHSALPIMKFMSLGGTMALAMDLMSNTNSFTGKKIIDKGDSAGEIMEKLVDYGLKWALPNIPAPGLGAALRTVGAPVNQGNLDPYAWTSIERAMKGAKSITGKTEGVGQTVVNTLGVKLDSRRLSEEIISAGLDYKAAEKEIRSEAMKAASAGARGAISKEESQRRIQAEIEKAKKLGEDIGKKLAPAR